MTTENIGDIVISPRVLEVITGIAAAKVDGVHSLRNKAMADSFSKTVLGKGVYLHTEEEFCTVLIVVKVNITFTKCLLYAYWLFHVCYLI